MLSNILFFCTIENFHISNYIKNTTQKGEDQSASVEAKGVTSHVSSKTCFRTERQYEGFPVYISMKVGGIEVGG